MRRRFTLKNIVPILLAVALVLTIGSTGAASAADYCQLARQALAAHENAKQPIRSAASEKRIIDAFDGLCRLLEQASAFLKRPLLDSTEVLSLLRSIESQRSLLTSAIERAQSDDDMTVRGVVVQQASARAMAEKQKAVDQQFLVRIDNILYQLREDFGMRPF